MLGPHRFRLLLNRHAGPPGMVVLPDSGCSRARAAIGAWPGYAPTPLLALPEFAAAARVAAVHWKDEGGRFGLGSFKALGGAYAVLGVVLRALSRAGVTTTARALEAGEHRDAAARVTVTCATDGNHGRSVAWGARRFGCRCVIFVHPGVSAGRRAAIAAFGAEVREVMGTYDDSVRAAAATAARENWVVVSDTAVPGDTEVPREVMQGYRVMVEEAARALPAAPTHAFVQGGVGGLAAAVAVQLRASFPDAVPRLVVVEPERAACLLASAEAGEPVIVPGGLDTLMAGLACGEPSLLAWQVLERAAFGYLAVPDAAAVDCMRLLARRTPAVVAGESAVAGLAGLLLATGEGYARAALELAEDSRILLFGTEGATDPELYQRLVDGAAITPAVPTGAAGNGR